MCSRGLHKYVLVLGNGWAEYLRLSNRLQKIAPIRHNCLTMQESIDPLVERSREQRRNFLRRLYGLVMHMGHNREFSIKECEPIGMNAGFQTRRQLLQALELLSAEGSTVVDVQAGTFTLTPKGMLNVEEQILATRNQNNDGTDRQFCIRTIEEARKSVPEDSRVHPKVGAVIVKNGEILSTAYRGESAQCHAEFIALEKKLSADLIAGATVYTTLEPCTTRRHPKIPCADRLIERKVKCVVIGMLDPNPDIRGKGWQLLREAGIETRMFDHDLMLQVEEQNREFSRLHRPSVAKNSSLEIATARRQEILTDGHEWTAKFLGHEQLGDAIAEIARSGSAYYRIIEMGPNPRGHEKSNAALSQALKAALIWHDNHPWPISVGLLEMILKSDSGDVQDPYVKKACHPTGVAYYLKMDHEERFEYVEARRDCTVTIIESDGRGFRRGQLLLDREIGRISDSLSFWSKFYAALLGPGNGCDLKMTWRGLKDVRLTVKDEYVLNLIPTLLTSPRFCRHSSPVDSEVLVAAPHNEAKWHFDFLRRTSGYILGQFDFDPPENLIRAVLDRYDSDLSDPPS